MVIRTADGEGDDDRRPREGAARDAAQLVLRQRAALRLQPARFSGLSAGVPGTAVTWSRGPAAVRREVAARGAAARHPRRRRRVRGRPDVRRPDRRGQALVRRHPGDRRALLDPDGTREGRRLDDPQPGPGQDVPADGAPGAGGFYRGPMAEAMVGAAPSRRSRPAPITRGAGLLARATSRAHGAGARADGSATGDCRSTAWGRRSSGGSADRRGAEYSRRLAPRARRARRSWHGYLEASRYAFADRNAYLADPATSRCRSGLISDGFADRAGGADHRPGGATPVPAGNPYVDQGDVAPTAAYAATMSPLGSSTTHLTWPTGRATSCRTRSRSSPPAATGSRCPGTGSCSTTS